MRPHPRALCWTAGLALLLATLLACGAAAQCTSEGCSAGSGSLLGPPPAQVPGLELPPPAVVRVMVVAGPVRSFGSGTVVHGEPAGCAVLTCAHLFRDGAQQVWVLAGTKQWKARLLAANPTWDLAVLEVPGWLDPSDSPRAGPDLHARRRCPVEPAAIAAAPPAPGQWVQSCGFGSDGRYRCSRGQVLGYARTGNTQGYETLALSGAARLGDSGGPVFDAQGQLVAVVWGTDGRTVVGTYCGRIRAFLAEVFGRRRPALPTPATPLPGVGSPGEQQGDGASPRPQAQAPPTTPQNPPGSPAERTTPPGSEGTAPAVPGASNPAPGRPRRSDPGPRSPPLFGKDPQSLDEALRLLAGLKDRLQRIETTLGPDNLRALLRDAASSAAGGGVAGPGLVEKLLPAVLVALGWTGPPAVAAVVALRVLAGLIRRRRNRKQASSGGALPTGPPGPWNDDYAAQLAQVFALSGRSVLADATLGREYDQELRQAEASSDAALAAWARGLRERVARRFFRIHGQSPAPAEPQA